MNKLEAFGKLFESERNAQRAALLISYALVIQLAGWDELPVGKSKKNGIRAAFAQAGFEPGEVAFHPGGADAIASVGRNLSKKEIEDLRVEQEREFGLLAANMHGRIDKKEERMERHNIIEEE
jgi:hypothetical protein